VGEEEDGFERAHEGHDYGGRYSEGEMLSEFSEAMSLIVANIWFWRSDLQQMTYVSCGCKTVVYYILMFLTTHRVVVRDIKVIRSEACILQNKLIICVLRFKGRVGSTRKEFLSNCRIGRVKKADQQNIFSVVS